MAKAEGDLLVFVALINATQDDDEDEDEYPDQSSDDDGEE